MFPEDFIKRIQNQKYVDAETLLNSLEEPSPVSILINPSKWKAAPLNSEPVPWCENGYYLPARPSYTLDPLFHSGCYYPREASGMFLEQAVRQTTETLDNIRVLDLCGSPGGKSIQLAGMIGDNSFLVTNEVIRSRAVVLAETVTKWGAANTMVTQNDPSAFGRLPGYFDLILVDAPCSGEGMFRNSIAVEEWSSENTVHCSVRQKRIIMDIWPSLKENGILIYSTCTFNPGENEENIKWLTSNHEAESVSLDIHSFKGIVEIDNDGIKGYGFYPDRVKGEGFFISVIRKKGKQNSNTPGNLKKPVLKPGKNDLDKVDSWTVFPAGRILKWCDEVIALPCKLDDYLYLFHNLKIVKPGTLLFVVKRDDYLPSHELALSNNLRNDSFPALECDLNEALSYLKRDNFSPDKGTKGWNIATYRTVNIGFLKNLGNRVNNYYPVEWRIRMEIPNQGNENIIKWAENE